MYGPSGWPCDEADVLSDFGVTPDFDGGPEAEMLHDARALPDPRLLLEVVTVNGRAAAVEILVRLGTVEIRHHRTLTATFDRAVFRKWLDDPNSPLASDGAIFSLDRTVDVHGRIAIGLPDVPAWALSPTELHALHRRV